MKSDSSKQDKIRFWHTKKRQQTKPVWILKILKTNKNGGNILICEFIFLKLFFLWAFSLSFFPTFIFLKLLSFHWFQFLQLLVHILFCSFSFFFFFYTFLFYFIPGSNCLGCFNFQFYFSVYLLTFGFANIFLLFFSHSFFSFFSLNVFTDAFIWTTPSR